MLYYKLNGYEDFKQRFGLEGRSNGTTVRKNKIKSKATNLIITLHLIDFPYHPARISYRQAICRNIFGYNTSCTNHTFLPYCHSR